jgi:hypothetical protein
VAHTVHGGLFIVHAKDSDLHPLLVVPIEAHRLVRRGELQRFSTESLDETKENFDDTH